MLGRGEIEELSFVLFFCVIVGGYRINPLSATASAKLHAVWSGIPPLDTEGWEAARDGRRCRVGEIFKE